MSSKVTFISNQYSELNPNFVNFVFYSQFFLPKWFSRMLGLNFFKIEPTNRLGGMFKRMLRERKQDGLNYNDLSETIENAIDKGLDMDEDTKLGNCLLGRFRRTYSWSIF